MTWSEPSFLALNFELLSRKVVRLCVDPFGQLVNAYKRRAVAWTWWVCSPMMSSPFLAGWHSTVGHKLLTNLLLWWRDSTCALVCSYVATSANSAGTARQRHGYMNGRIIIWKFSVTYSTSRFRTIQKFDGLLNSVQLVHRHTKGHRRSKWVSPCHYENCRHVLSKLRICSVGSCARRGKECQTPSRMSLWRRACNRCSRTPWNHCAHVRPKGIWMLCLRAKLTLRLCTMF